MSVLFDRSVHNVRLNLIVRLVSAMAGTRGS